MLLHRHGFAGQGRLVDLQIGRFDQAAVHGHPVAGLKDNEIARHEVCRRHHGHLAAPAHPAAGRHHVLERLHGLLGAQLLYEADHGHQPQHGPDDGRIQNAFDQQFDERGRHEDVGQRVRQLAEEQDDERRLCPGLQRVRPEAGQARGCFGHGQPGARRVKLPQRLVGREAIQVGRQCRRGSGSIMGVQRHRGKV